MYQGSIQVQIQLLLVVSVGQGWRQSNGEYEPVRFPSMTVLLRLYQRSSALQITTKTTNVFCLWFSLEIRPDGK